MSENIDRFLHYLRVERGASAHTQDAYSRDLRQLAQFARQRGYSLQDALSENGLLAFSQYLRQQGLAEVSIERKLCAARAFARFLRQEGVLPRRAVPSGSPFFASRVNCPTPSRVRRWKASSRSRMSGRPSDCVTGRCWS